MGESPPGHTGHQARLCGIRTLKSRHNLFGKRSPKPLVHFVGFRDDRYWNAVAVFGEPAFIHVGFDRRALREIAEGDIVVFADGSHDQAPRERSYPDIFDGSEVVSQNALRRSGE